MISLKKHIEFSPEKSVKTLCDSYRASLTAMGVSATQVCPHIGEDFQRDLLQLRDQLCPGAAPDLVEETGKQVEEEVKKWGESASEYFQQTARDIKEIMLLVAASAQAVGERDQRYAGEFIEFAGQLAGIADLEDLTKVRQSLGKNAQQLKLRVEKMVQEGEQSMARLRSELSVYQTQLDEVERVATQDPVTGIANRYKAERQINLRIERGSDFSIAIFDLDDFKQTNDLYGHPAGDALLKQFAGELRSFFRKTDVISRWGGDEFLAVVDCGPGEVRNRIEPIRKWVDGDYDIQVNGELRKVHVRASVGIASWQAGQAAEDLIAVADAAMYTEKAGRKKAAKESEKRAIEASERSKR